MKDQAHRRGASSLFLKKDACFILNAMFPLLQASKNNPFTSSVLICLVYRPIFKYSLLQKGLEGLDMYVNVAKVNGLAHTEAINRKLARSTGDEEEKKGVFLRRDIAMLSQKGKTMSAVERLMKQKDFIRECKDSLIEQMVDKESGYCSADIAKKIEEYEKQLDSIDEEIAKELAKSTDEPDEPGENNIYKEKQPLTEQELNNKKMAKLTEMSGELDKSERIDSVKNRLEGEKNVLEAELKSGDSERKRQRIAEIDDRIVELTKEAFAGIGKIISEPEENEILAREESEVEEEENGADKSR